MSAIFQTTGKVSEDELNALLADELARRRAVNAGLGSVPGAAMLSKAQIQKSLVDDLMGEFEDIRNDPALRDQNFDQMERTYRQYLAQGNDPVEIFVPNNQSQWAAGQLPDGRDVVFYDPGAPHAAVMAHELGHVQMNHSRDPLSFLQTSGIGKMSHAAAPALGAVGGIAGGMLNRKNRMAGTAMGTGAGAVLGSGNFAYELGGASGRALGYLPEDVDKMDAAGDLLRAGMTYGVGGPGAALAAGAGAGAVAELVRRMR